MNETSLTSEQKLSIKRLHEINTYKGDGEAAFRLFSGYTQGEDEGFQKDLNLAFHYLECSADLSYPHALDFMASLYMGIEICGLKKEPNLQLAVQYLKRLVVSDSVYDFNKVENDRREEFYRIQWDAYAKLGRLYITEDILYNTDNYLGYAISLRLAEGNGITQSMYALGRYYRDRADNLGNLYYPSQTLMNKRDIFGMALYYYELAINNDNSRYAQAAMNEYNHLAQYINEHDGRNSENAIPYYRR